MQRKRAKFVGVFVSLVAAVALAVPAWSQDPARMGEIIRSQVDSRGFMGTVLVARGDEVLLSEGYGSANLEWDIANTPSTKFRLGSVTKQFTAASILILEGPERNQNATEVWLVSETHARKLDSGHGGRWSPDGSHVAITTENGIHIHDLRSSSVTPIFRDAGARFAASWSPEGRLVAVVASDGQLHTYDLDHELQTQLTEGSVVQRGVSSPTIRNGRRTEGA